MARLETDRQDSARALEEARAALDVKLAEMEEAQGGAVAALELQVCCRRWRSNPSEKCLDERLTRGTVYVARCVACAALTLAVHYKCIRWQSITNV